MEPTVVIEEHRPGGALRYEDLQRAVALLRRGGLVITPSDTSYALSGVPLGHGTVTRINRLLRRGNEPNSLAFGSLGLLRVWATLTAPEVAILERFCPGPVTLVVEADPRLSNDFLLRLLGSERRTLGVRIPDSQIERQLSIELVRPLTTAAIRDFETGEPLDELAAAVQLVESEVARLGAEVPLVAIHSAGPFPYAQNSTVAEVVERPDGGYEARVKREGALPAAALQTALDDLHQEQLQPELH